MKHQGFFPKQAILCYLVLGLFLLTEALAAEVPRISKEDLQAMLGNPEVILIDVRADGDWAAGDSKIKGALREDPSKLETWIDKYPKEKTLVFY